MYTMKETVRDSIIAEMRPHLDAVLIDLLNQAIVRALFDVTVTESETLPATRDNTNEHILQLYMAKKAPKLSKKTVKYYLLTIKHFLEFSQKSLLEVSDLDVEFYLQEYGRKGNQASTINNERRNLSAFFTWMRKTHLITENPVDSVEPLKTIDKPIDYLEDWEMEALRDACKIEKTSKVTGIREYRECLRDRALLEFLRSTAVRVSEGVSVNIEDIDWKTGELVVYGSKNRSYRNLGIRAGLERRVYPHLLRKTTATNMAKRGCERELIAFYLGHKDGRTRTLNKHYAAADKGQIIAAFHRFGAAA